MLFHYHLCHMRTAAVCLNHVATRRPDVAVLPGTPNLLYPKAGA